MFPTILMLNYEEQVYLNLNGFLRSETIINNPYRKESYKLWSKRTHSLYLPNESL